jgi:hypothetical protein
MDTAPWPTPRDADAERLRVLKVSSYPSCRFARSVRENGRNEGSSRAIAEICGSGRDGWCWYRVSEHRDGGRNVRIRDRTAIGGGVAPAPGDNGVRDGPKRTGGLSCAGLDPPRGRGFREGADNHGCQPSPHKAVCLLPSTNGIPDQANKLTACAAPQIGIGLTFRSRPSYVVGPTNSIVRKRSLWAALDRIRNTVKNGRARARTGYARATDSAVESEVTFIGERGVPLLLLFHLAVT